MFGSRDIPFHGDYNWISLADDPAARCSATWRWTDNRDVVAGADPRETEAEDGFNDGFDVLQCRVDLGAAPDDVAGRVPLARSDAPYHGGQLRQRRRPRPEHLR